jgi:hypothetical protein
VSEHRDAGRSRTAAGGPGTAAGGPGTARPALRVVSGDATPEEIAAVLAVVSARRRGPAGAGAAVGAGAGAGAGAAHDRDGVDTWAAHGFAHRHVRAWFAPSAHGWRTSYWPR